MAERAHPEDPGFQGASPYRANLFKRHEFANKFTEGKIVLDIPCGVGWGTSLLRAKHRIGIDLCPEAIAYGNSHYPGIDFSVGDMASIPLKENSVDVIVCLEGFEHVGKATGTQFLEEAARVIKESGSLVMTVPVILPGGKHSGDPHHLHEPALSELKNIVAHKFYIQSLEVVDGADGPVVYFVGSPKDKTKTPKFSHEESGIRYPKKSTSNILLTTSAAPTQSPFSTSEKRPPIGLGFLISVLRKAGHKVFFIDNYLQPTNFLETDYLQKHQIDYVGIYTNTICFRDTLRMVHKLEHLRQTHKWNGKIITGGPHTTVAVDTIPDFVDYIVQGEGEQAILDIVDGKVTERIVNYPRIKDLDVLPMPAWDCFVNLPYDWSIDFFQSKPVFTMNTSRGCPFKCTFCSVCSIWGKKYTYFSAERIVSDIEYLIKHHGAKGIYFREDNFTLKKERLSRFCNLLIDKGIKIPWACESRVSNLTREIVELMARAGAKGFYFGVESGSQRILDLLQKDITPEQTINAFKWCHEFGIKAAASTIVGVPGETESDRQKTNELLNQIKPDVVWSNIFVGIPDSNLYRFVLDNRLYQYIDDRGLIYLQGHNDKVQHYYGGKPAARIPDNEKSKDFTIKPKISVLISVYNCEKFIEQALKSIYSQVYQDFEVIIVDDASTDKTSEILVKMKDSRTFIYRNSKNLGLTKSLNIGLKLCKGEYIARADADDISYPQRFEKQVRFLDENLNCLAVGSWCDRIDSNGEIHGAYDKRPAKPEDLKKGLLAGNCIAHSSAMMRRSSLVEIGGYNEKYIYAQDHDLWLRLSEIGDIQNLEEHLIGLRFWPGNITSLKTNQQKECSNHAAAEALRRRNRIGPVVEISDIKYCKQQLNSTPKFSIIMASYNNSKYIAEAIDSVLNQTFKEWELIIIEDCSTDDSLAIINQYLNDKRIRLIQHERNQGYIAALKSGVANVKSKYFGVLDGDDCLTGSAIETMYSHHIDFPDAGLIYSQFMCCDEDLTPVRDGYSGKIPEGKTNLEANMVSAFRTFKIADYLKTSGYDEDILYAEDKDISFKMEEVSQLLFVNECLYLYRELPDSQSHESTKAFIGRVSHEKAKIKALKRRKELLHRRQMPNSQRRSEREILVDTVSEAAAKITVIKKTCTALAKSGNQSFETLFRQAIETAKTDYEDVDTYFVILGKVFRILKEANENGGRLRYLDLPTDIMSWETEDSILWIAANVGFRKILEVIEVINNCASMGTKPLISVYMVTYNNEKFIRQAIDSVLGQTYHDFELLIIDDGSTDSTRQIVDSYTDPRIRYIVKPHKNFASGMNRAIIEANGKYVIGVDSDDFIEPDYIEKMVTCAEKHPDVDYFYPGGFTLVDESGTATAKWEYLDFSNNKILPAFLLDRGCSPIPNQGSLKRTSMFRKIKLYEELDTVEDFVFLCKNALKIKFKRVDEYSAYFYRRLASGNSHKFKARNQFTAQALNDMVSMYPSAVLRPQITSISNLDLRQQQYYKDLMTIFYKHANDNKAQHGEYFQQYGDFYKAELLRIVDKNRAISAAVQEKTAKEKV